MPKCQLKYNSEFSKSGGMSMSYALMCCHYIVWTNQNCFLCLNIIQHYPQSYPGSEVKLVKYLRICQIIFISWNKTHPKVVWSFKWAYIWCWTVGGWSIRAPNYSGDWWRVRYCLPALSGAAGCSDVRQGAARPVSEGHHRGTDVRAPPELASPDMELRVI